MFRVRVRVRVRVRPEFNGKQSARKEETELAEEREEYVPFLLQPFPVSCLVIYREAFGYSIWLARGCSVYTLAMIYA